MKKWTPVVIIVVVVVVGLALAAGKAMRQSGGEPAASGALPEAPAGAVEKAAKGQGTAQGTGVGMAAMEQAAQAKKYLFVFFWKEENDETAAMRKVFEAATKKAAGKAQSAAVHITDASEKQIVKKFELDRAPMPLALAIAPNGAIMGGFPKKFTEGDLLDAFASPCSEQCMKALQDGKLVFLCVQNKNIKSSEEAMRGVHDFKADARYSQATEVVMLDPVDSAETKFLADLKIDPRTPEAITAFLVPPGSVIAEFKGPTYKDGLVDTLQKAASSTCGPGGCGPGGCGPKK